MVALLPSWLLREVVTALRALRGVAQLGAIALVAEIGQFRRFADPRQLRACVTLC